MRFDYIYPSRREMENSFWVFSDLANVDYLVVVDNESEKSRAMEIAEKAFSEWFENDESFGYIECVANALEEAEIEAKYYDNVEF